MSYELSIFTGDGWVVSLLADKPMSLDDAVLSSVIVQPREEYDKGLGQRGFGRQRRIYRLNVQGEVVYEEQNK